MEKKTTLSGKSLRKPGLIGVLLPAAPFAALTLAALTLTACLATPAPHSGGGAYYQPAPVYVGPRYYHGQRYYHGPRHHHKRWHHWHGGGWRGDNH